MSISFNKLGGSIHSFGTKLSKGLRSFGQKVDNSHFFRKAYHTMEQVNQGLGVASSILPVLSPVHTAGKLLEMGSKALSGIRFGGQQIKPPPRPMLER